MGKKIKTLEELQKITIEQKNKGKKIVHCHGVFDLLHVGHIKHFQEAKTFGDALIVTITPDEFINKGPNRPAFTTALRLEVLAALEPVDFVAANKWPIAVETIKMLKPAIYCKGPDYKNHADDITGNISDEEEAVKSIGGEMRYTSDITFSSSSLLNKFGDLYSDEQKSFIKKIVDKHSFDSIKTKVEELKNLKVLVIGETIIDQYVFCDALGKSGKESVLVLRELNTEQYLGGAAAISRHLSQFCSKITLLSMLGGKSEFLREIEKNLPKNIKFNYIKKKNSPTIVKKRFLDYVNKNKVLGVYKIDDDALTNDEEKLFIFKLKKLLSSHDLVIVSDYGHGLISKKSSKIICKNSKYLALNAQINAANVGYHSMRNYENVNCVIINERELRHELRNKNGNLEILMKRLTKEQNIKNLVVTRGDQGSVFYNEKKNKFNLCEAYAKTVTDKIGSGDVMLAVIALCLKSGFIPELALLTGSLAAAQSVETIGNKDIISKTKILKTYEHLLK